jgi:hypothetical protein
MLTPNGARPGGVAAVVATVALAAVIAIFSSVALAHQPNLVGRRTLIRVDEPEVSKAYYGELTGRPAVYEIRAPAPFTLYVNILVPDLPGIGTDLVAEVSRDGEMVAVLDGRGFTWTKFHEPFAGDDYLMGPEFRSAVGAGTYRIRVTNGRRVGKYVLAVGEAERFPPKVILRTLVDLPKLKRDFFEKSPWGALFTRVTLPLVAAVVVVVAVAAALLLG